MSWQSCPICERKNAPNQLRCSACGADFSDPQVQALIGQEQSFTLPTVDAGQLSRGRFLGWDGEGLKNGSSLRKLSLIGGIAIILGFFLPLSLGFEKSLPAWSSELDGPTWALYFPLLAVVLGGLSNLPTLQPWQACASLVATGSIGLLSLPSLGKYSGSPQVFLPVLFLALLVATWGFVLRSYSPKDTVARKLLIAAALLVILAYFVPGSSGNHMVPIELAFYLNENLGSSSPFSAFTTTFNRDPLVFFNILYLMAPLFLIPIGAALAWRVGEGPWDKGALLIRPIAGFIVMYVPIGFALFLFNLLGAEGRAVIIERNYILWDDFSSAALMGRFRQLLLASGYAMWASLPIVGAVTVWRQKSTSNPE